MKKKILNINKIAILLLGIFLGGCGKSALYTNLDEKEANEMMAILQSKKIDCHKQKGKEDFAWDVFVNQTRFGDSVTILSDHGHPRSNFESMGEIFKKTGLVSSPLEERVRFMYALSENISKTLTYIKGVVNARVHVVLPDNDPYAEKIMPSSAAVFISYLPTSNVEDFVKEIKLLVINSIEGLSYEKVTVALFPAEVSSEFFKSQEKGDKMVKALSIRMSPDSVGRFWMLIGAVFTLFSIALFFALYEWWINNKTKK